MTGVEIRLAGADPVAVEAAADELKARFGSRSSVTHRSRRTAGGLIKSPPASLLCLRSITNIANAALNSIPLLRVNGWPPGTGSGRRAPTTTGATASPGAQRWWAAIALRQVADGDDADEALVAVHHRHTAKLLLGHVVRHMPQILVFEYVFWLLAYDLVHLRARRISALGDHT
jgi:hypothetical protein